MANRRTLLEAVSERPSVYVICAKFPSSAMLTRRYVQIGINYYHYENGKRKGELRSCVHDAQNMRDLLISEHPECTSAIAFLISLRAFESAFTTGART